MKSKSHVNKCILACQGIETYFHTPPKFWLPPSLSNPFVFDTEGWEENAAFLFFHLMAAPHREHDWGVVVPLLGVRGLGQTRGHPPYFDLYKDPNWKEETQQDQYSPFCNILNVL